MAKCYFLNLVFQSDWQNYLTLYGPISDNPSRKLWIVGILLLGRPGRLCGHIMAVPLSLEPTSVVCQKRMYDRSDDELCSCLDFAVFAILTAYMDNETSIQDIGTCAQLLSTHLMSLGLLGFHGKW